MDLPLSNNKKNWWWRADTYRTPQWKTNCWSNETGNQRTTEKIELLRLVHFLDSFMEMGVEYLCALKPTSICRVRNESSWQTVQLISYNSNINQKTDQGTVILYKLMITKLVKKFPFMEPKHVCCWLNKSPQHSNQEQLKTFHVCILYFFKIHYSSL